MRTASLLCIAASLFALMAPASAMSLDHAPRRLERRAPLVPAEDSFYDAPSSDSHDAGTIIRTREVQLGAVGLLPLAIKSSHQFLHWTIDLYGKPQANMATLIIPKRLKLTKDGVPRLVVYQVAEDSAWSACAASYQLRAGGQGNLLVQAEILAMNHILDKGHMLVLTDYEGPQSAFTVGKLAGSGVLDAVRASLNFDLIVPKTKSHLVPVALMGYSGGALASAWALELQPTYAPELSQNLVAGILGSLPVNTRNILLKQNGNILAGLVAAGVAGQANARPDLLRYFQMNMSPAGLDVMRTVNRTCLPQALVGNAFRNFFDYFDITKEEVLAAEPVRTALDESVLGQPGTPVSKVPRYLYIGVQDEVVSAPDVASYVEQQCASGADMTYVRELVATHGTLALTGAAKAYAFLEDRFNGVPISGCTTETVTLSLLDPQALLIFGATLLSQLNLLLGKMQGGTLKALVENLGANM